MGHMAKGLPSLPLGWARAGRATTAADCYRRAELQQKVKGKVGEGGAGSGGQAQRLRWQGGRHRPRAASGRGQA